MVDNVSVGEGLVPSRGDVSGQNERDGTRPSPTKIVWQPDESIGSGVYLVRAPVGDKSITKRIVYLK